MKTKAKLFVASSSIRRPLVEALRQELKEQSQGYDLELDFQAWYRDVAEPGQHVLDALIDHCRGNKDEGIQKSDFFAAFLTNDDQRTKNEVQASVPRDNCIFELGLFMGGVGFNFRRCFMLCSVNESALPSDVKGRTYIPFNEPSPGSGPAEYRAAVRDAASTAWNAICKLGPLPTQGL
jgi:predicted nucleotide-binding protein